MLKVKFSRSDDEIKSFSSYGELFDFVRRQEEAWNDWLNSNAAGRTGITDVFDLRNAWRSLSENEMLRRLWHIHEMELDEYNKYDIIKIIENEKNRDFPLVIFDSTVGNALREVWSESGFNGMANAYNFYRKEFHNDLILEEEYLQMEGVLNFFTKIQPDKEHFNQLILKGIRQIIIDSEDKIKSYIMSSDEMEAIRGAKATHNIIMSDFKSRFDNQQERNSKQFDDLLKSYEEKIRIDSMINLWEGLSSKFSRKLNRAWWWVWGVALGGAFFGVLWVLGSFEIARYLFQFAIYPPLPTEKILAGTLRPTFHFEMIVVAAATLFYVTMFFWMMRLLVKNVFLQQHLMIDATARASMGQTYFALLKEGGAKEEDRAIPLAALFRPVVDGIMKEDGPPAITPGAVIANLLQSKNG